MKIKVGDMIVVTAGKEKGKTGKVLKTFSKDNKVVVEKLNMRTKFIKKSHQGPGQKVEFEARMDASNVMLIDPKTKKRTRVGYKHLDNGKKVRIAKQSKEELN